MTKPSKIHNDINNVDPLSELDRIIQIQVEIAKINTELPHLATKTELIEVKAELKAAIAEVKTDVLSLGIPLSFGSLEFLSQVAS